MSTLKVNTIQDTTGDNALTFDSSGNTTVAQDLTVTGQLNSVNGNGFPSAGALSHRNLIINGGMTVAQYGTSSTTTNSFTCDRFKVKFDGENEDPTYAQHALTSSDTGPWAKGFRNSLHITNGNQTSNDADDGMFIKYFVEAQDMANSGWDYGSASSKITLSFWLQTSANQTFYGYVYLPDGGSGTHRRYSFSFTASGNNAWTKITQTIPGGGTGNVITNDTGTGLEILLCPGAGSSITASGSTLDAWKVTDGASWFPDMATTWWDTDDATFEITGVQLEVGDTATEFEHRSYAEELVRCQRYCYKIDCENASGNVSVFGLCFAQATDTFRWPHQWPQRMRTVPSLSASSGSHFKVYDGSNAEVCNSVVIDAASSFSGIIVFGSSGTSMNVGHAPQVYANDTQLAWILLTAEL